MGIFTPNIKKLVSKQNQKGLIKALKYKDSSIRKEAFDALRNANWEPSDNIEKAYYSISGGDYHELTRIKPDMDLLNNFLRDDDDNVKIGIICVIGDLAYSEAINGLGEILQDEQEGVEVRETAADSLAKIGGSDAISKLRDTIELSALRASIYPNNSTIRDYSINVLGDIGEDGIEALKKADASIGALQNVANQARDA